jgi:methylenetetrahydrofolate reductase (NADPH)
MKIADKLATGCRFVSVEYFPPKDRQDWPAFFKVVERLASLNPLFASVTYGAGGSNQDATLEIVTTMQQLLGLETMAHLTCVGAQSDRLNRFLDDLTAVGIQNVLALRGDPPQDTTAEQLTESPLHFASDLVTFVRQSHQEMGVGVAAYPEMHPEASSPEADLGYLKLKLDLGGDFAITQLFFENQLYFDFIKRAQERGISKLIIPGILPILNLKMIERIKQLSGAYIPPDFMAALEAADQRGGAAEVRKVGVAHARKQAEELLDAGVQGVHLYTFNKAEAILELTEGLLP